MRRSAAQLCLLTDRGSDWGNLPNPAKLLYIAEKPEDKETVRQKFKRAGLNINYVDGSRYLRAYLGPREELEEWVRPNVEAWYHGVCILSKIAKWYPQFAYAGLGMSLQIKWQYLQRILPWFGSSMGPIEDPLREPSSLHFSEGRRSALTSEKS